MVCRFVNYIVSGLFPLEITRQRREKFMHEVKFYLWDEPFLYKQCANQIIRRCVPEEEFQSILQHCHSSPYGGHFGGARTPAKVLQLRFYWPSLFKDAHEFTRTCDRCQRVGNISNQHEMPLNNILEMKLFDV